MDEIYSLQADVLKTLASPRRLEILHRLAEGPCEVGRLAEELGLSQPNVSQHLAVLRSAGVVEAERDGREVRYRLADDDVMVACSIMRGVLQRRNPPARRAVRPHPPGSRIDLRSDYRLDHARPARRRPPLAEVAPMDESLNLVLFSGTDDKLQAAVVLAAGAAALGRPVNVFLQYWALDAFRADRIDRDHGLASEAGVEGRVHVDALRAAGQASWAETLRQAKELGGVDIEACSLSMDLLGLEQTDLDPLVDGVEGVTAFFLNAGAGQVVFI